MSARSLAALALAVGLAVGCGPGNVLDGGTVVGRSYDDADYWTSTVCASYGRYGCNVWVPITNHDPAHWYLTIRGRYEGEVRTEDHEVSADAFYSIPDGAEADLRGDGIRWTPGGRA